MNVKISQKLIGSFLIVSLIFGLASFFSYKNMKETNDSYKYVIGTVAELSSITQSIQTEMALQIGYYRAYMLYEKPEYMDKFNEANKKVDVLIQEGEKISTLQETRNRFDTITKLNDSFHQTADQVMSMMSTNRPMALDKGLHEIVPLSDGITNKTDALYQWLNKDIKDKKIQETENQSNSGLTQVFILSVVAAIIALCSGVFISIIISRPLVKLNNTMKRVASGDLRVEKLTIKGRDELYYLNQSFQQMTEHLREMISEIAGYSEQVAAAAQELNASADQSIQATEAIASASQEIASGAERTTSKMEKTSSSLQEVLQGVVRISDNTTKVSELSRVTETEAEEGDRFVRDNLSQMRFIFDSVKRSNNVISTLSERSQEIGKILDVISDIAEQTNMLALNAAIEAARAGEHGKGFAVVADEVRKLAEQSKLSTKNIENLISQVQKDTEKSVEIMSEVMVNAEKGVKVSEQTSDKFAQILNSTRNITPQIEDVSATVQEISAGIEEISSSADEIVRLAQDNASSSEEVAASTEENLASMEEIDSYSQSLSDMAEKLKTLIDRFKI